MGWAGLQRGVACSPSPSFAAGPASSPPHHTPVSPPSPAGLRFLEVARQVFQQACRSGSVFPRPVLEVLVLMLRSDAVHKHPHVSRQAYRWV